MTSERVRPDPEQRRVPRRRQEDRDERQRLDLQHRNRVLVARTAERQHDRPGGDRQHERDQHAAERHDLGRARGDVLQARIVVAGGDAQDRETHRDEQERQADEHLDDPRGGDVQADLLGVAGDQRHEHDEQAEVDDPENARGGDRQPDGSQCAEPVARPARGDEVAAGEQQRGGQERREPGQELGPEERQQRRAGDDARGERAHEHPLAQDLVHRQRAVAQLDAERQQHRALHADAEDPDTGDQRAQHHVAVVAGRDGERDRDHDADSGQHDPQPEHVREDLAPLLVVADRHLARAREGQPRLADALDDRQQRHDGAEAPEVLDPEVAQQQDGAEDREEVRQDESGRALRAPANDVAPDVRAGEHVARAQLGVSSRLGHGLSV